MFAIIIKEQNIRHQKNEAKKIPSHTRTFRMREREKQTKIIMKKNNCSNVLF